MNDLPYHPDTAELIERMCRNVEREDFILNKKKAEECILKTYDLFGLNRPKRIIWYVDFFNEEWNKVTMRAWRAGSAGSAGSARSARSARSAMRAMRARSAGSARSARSARSAMRAMRARSARSVMNAMSVRSVRSTWSTRSALDYDFDDFIFEFEYCKNPNLGHPPNKNDFKFLEYCELLMQAKEYGLGYRIEFEDTLHLVPTPLVKIDSQNRFHYEHGSAIKWKGGNEFYYLHGVNFPKELYLKVISREMPMDEILKIEDIDQRTQAMKFAKEGIREFYKSQGGKMKDRYIKESENGDIIRYELWEIPKGEIFTKIIHFAVYDCPSGLAQGQPREYAKGVPEFDTIAEAMAWGMSNDVYKLSPETWKKLVPLVHES